MNGPPPDWDFENFLVELGHREGPDKLHAFIDAIEGEARNIRKFRADKDAGCAHINAAINKARLN